MPRPRFDQLYVLRLDLLGRARGARFARLTDQIASAAIDGKFRALILQPRTVMALAMLLPPGRLHQRRLVAPRIPRALYNQILNAAATAEARRAVRMKAAAAKQAELIRKLITEANKTLADARRSRPNDRA